MRQLIEFVALVQVISPQPQNFPSHGCEVGWKLIRPSRTVFSPYVFRGFSSNGVPASACCEWLQPAAGIKHYCLVGWGVLCLRIAIDPRTSRWQMRSVSA